MAGPNPTRRARRVGLSNPAETDRPRAGASGPETAGRVESPAEARGPHPCLGDEMPASVRTGQEGCVSERVTQGLAHKPQPLS